MEINFLQIGRNLADAGRDQTGAGQASSSQAIVVKENSNSAVLSERQQNAQDFSKQAEKEDRAERVLSSEEISAAVEGLSDFAKTTNRHLNFSIDEGTDKQVVKVTDAESGKVIRQIPSEEILRLSERLRELRSDLGATVGILFNKQV
jgi:flagellar protein FlaG